MQNNPSSVTSDITGLEFSNKIISLRKHSFSSTLKQQYKQKLEHAIENSCTAYNTNEIKNINYNFFSLIVN